MDNQKVIDYLIDIKEACARIETKVDHLYSLYTKQQNEAYELASEVDILKTEVSEARGSIRALKWALGVVLALPGVVYAAIKLLS